MKAESCDATSDFPELDACSVGRAAEGLVLSLPFPRDPAFRALFNYVAMDEPAIHLMPLHFLPHPSRGLFDRDLLRSLGVAAKLEYARSRWIDEIVDLECKGTLVEAHHLHGAIVDLISTLFSEVLQGRADNSAFFPMLAGLYARHGASVAVDGSWSRDRAATLTEEGYTAQVRARHGAIRASVDAVLLLANASVETLQAARKSWHLWALGAQLYDDALDVEEDYQTENLTWTVARTLSYPDGDPTSDLWSDHDAFYEASLLGGALTDTLTWAESCFRSAARLAEEDFPSWAALQRGCLEQTSKLRKDFQDLITSGT